MSYPRNAASPERIAIGAVILIADGTVQTSGVAVTVRGQGGAEAGSGGTIAYGATGIVYYTPTQAETDYTSFTLIASKASCIPISCTIVTSERQTGDSYARLGAPAGASIAADLDAVKSDTAAILLDTGTDGVLVAPVHRAANYNGVAQSGTVSQITLAAGASAIDSIYVGQKISIYDGTGSGQTRGISSYNGTTKVCAVARNWTVAPDNTSLYRIEYDFGPRVNNALDVYVADNGLDLTAIPNLDVAVSTRPTAIENADALLNRDMSVGTDDGSPSVRTVRQALRFLRNKWSISGTTLTVTKEDDSTASWTATVSTDASALPVTGNDPA